MIKVTVLITTYNLEKYIEQCLDSILAQKVNFQYKILIGDDASTDRTVDILKKYQSEYPKIIELVLRNRNIGSLENSVDLYSKCSSEFFAFVDGDDYWVSDDKLQKQVDFLEVNSDFVICGGNTKYLYEGLRGKEKYVVPRKFVGKDYSIQDYYKQRVPFVHTSSILFRNIIFREQVPQAYYDAIGTYEEPALRGEDFRFLIHLNEGKMYIMDEVLSVYRIHSGGIWQGSNKIVKAMESVITYNYNRKYWKEHEDFFEGLQNEAYSNLMKKIAKEKRIMEKCSLSEREHMYLVSILNEMCNKRKQEKEDEK